MWEWKLAKIQRPKRKIAGTSKNAREHIQLADSASKGPGKPTIGDDELLEQSDGWTYLLETYWGEVGRNLKRVGNLEEIRQALEPISKAGHTYHPFTLLLRPGIESANPKNISKTKEELANAVSRWKEADGNKNETEKRFNIVKVVADELSPENEKVLKHHLRETRISLSQKKSDIRKLQLSSKKAVSSERGSLEARLASLRNECLDREQIISQIEQRLRKITPSHRRAVHKILDERRAALAIAQRKASEANGERERIEARLSDEQANYCQQQLLAFIQGKRYEYTPRRLANAIAGLPHIGCRQSALRSGKLPYLKEPAQSYRVFLFADEVWQQQKGLSTARYLDSFRKAVCNLPPKQLMEIPGSRALGFSWTPNCDENESEITRRCV